MKGEQNSSRLGRIRCKQSNEHCTGHILVRNPGVVDSLEVERSILHGQLRCLSGRTLRECQVRSSLGHPPLWSFLGDKANPAEEVYLEQWFSTFLF